LIVFSEGELNSLKKMSKFFCRKINGIGISNIGKLCGISYKFLEVETQWSPKASPLLEMYTIHTLKKEKCNSLLEVAFREGLL